MPKFSPTPQQIALWETHILGMPKEDRLRYFNSWMAQLETDPIFTKEDTAAVSLEFLGLLETLLHK